MSNNHCLWCIVLYCGTVWVKFLITLAYLCQDNKKNIIYLNKRYKRTIVRKFCNIFNNKYINLSKTGDFLSYYLCQQITLKKLSQTGIFFFKVKVSVVVYHQKRCQKSFEVSLKSSSTLTLKE